MCYRPSGIVLSVTHRQANTRTSNPETWCFCRYRRRRHKIIS